MIGRIRALQFPDEWVLRGNHHDAWVNGAQDPVSGLVALLEEARSFGELVKQGWKPKRTIVYCAWDGEEPGLLGSTEWVEEHSEELLQHAVAYFNSDTNGRGYFRAEGSHVLEKFINGVARDIIDPEKDITIWERRKLYDIAHAQTPEQRDEIRKRPDLRIGALGDGSTTQRLFTIWALHPRISDLAARVAAVSTTRFTTIFIGTHISGIQRSGTGVQSHRWWGLP